MGMPTAAVYIVLSIILAPALTRMGMLPMAVGIPRKSITWAPMATAFATRKTGLPEPLAAIWEPLGLQAAETHLQTAESSCPRKFLLNTETALVFPEDDLWVANANEPEEYEALMQKLNP